MSERVSNSQPTGSPGGEPLFLAVGKFSRPHGVHGDVLLQLYTDFPERLKPGTTVFAGSEHLPLRIRHRREHSGRLILSFDEYSNPEEVGVLRNQYLFVRADTLPSLPEGEYYHHELIGMQVVTEEGKPLGVLNQIIETGANDVYVVQPENGREVLLPAIDEVILDIDLAQNEMRVHLLPGLLSD